MPSYLRLSMPQPNRHVSYPRGYDTVVHYFHTDTRAYLGSERIRGDGIDVCRKEMFAEGVAPQQDCMLILVYKFRAGEVQEHTLTPTGTRGQLLRHRPATDQETLGTQSQRVMMRHPP